MSSYTAEQRRAALDIVIAMADAIRSLGSVPSGELYTRMMGKLDIHSYNAVIGSLKAAGLVEEKYHLLTWVGPKFDAEGKRV